MIAAGLVAVAGWSLYATGSTLFRTGGASYANVDNRELAKYERWVQELRAKESLSRSLLEERTDAFQRATTDLEDRHDTLKVLLDALQGGEDIETTALYGDGSDLLVQASIDEADSRQSRDSAPLSASMEVVGLRAQISDVQRNQERFLNEAEEIAVERAERARGILRLTAVGTGRIDTDRPMGGPIVNPYNENLKGEVSPDRLAFENRVSQVAARLEEAMYYEKILSNLPLAQPVGVPYRETSQYGLRVDPFTKRPGWHNGMDMAAYRNAPIVAAGPGKVTIAGAKSGYGRVVEIDHGYGFRTRYGHLRKVNVSVGDTVSIGDNLGGMGTTGRSTGDHLHYEVWFHDKPYDPAKFLKAGKHVHQE